ncbi:MAG: c-type cytochrome [Chakrabartia sp.]
MKKIVLLATVALLAGCGSKPASDSADSSTETVTPTQTASADVRPDAFGQCAACHAVAKGAPHGLGPNLWGIAGTKAGDIKDYEFSPALKASGLVWDEATLDKWIENPRALVPGTKMSFMGISDPATRKELVSWLMKQK